MGYIIKSKRYKMQDHYKYNVRAPRSPLSVALKIQPKLQVLLKQSTSPTTESATSTSARTGNEQAGRRIIWQNCSFYGEMMPCSNRGSSSRRLVNLDNL